MIELFDGWMIDVDQQAYTLKKKTIGKSRKGERIERDNVRGYYGTLEGALKALGKELVKEELIDGSHTLTEALDIVERTRVKIENLINEKAKV